MQMHNYTCKRETKKFVCCCVYDNFILIIIQTIGINIAIDIISGADEGMELVLLRNYISAIYVQIMP